MMIMTAAGYRRPTGVGVQKPTQGYHNRSGAAKEAAQFRKKSFTKPQCKSTHTTTVTRQSTKTTKQLYYSTLYCTSKTLLPLTRRSSPLRYRSSRRGRCHPRWCCYGRRAWHDRYRQRWRRTARRRRECVQSTSRQTHRHRAAAARQKDGCAAAGAGAGGRRRWT